MALLEAGYGHGRHATHPGVNIVVPSPYTEARAATFARGNNIDRTKVYSKNSGNGNTRRRPPTPPPQQQHRYEEYAERQGSPLPRCEGCQKCR